MMAFRKGSLSAHRVTLLSIFCLAFILLSLYNYRTRSVNNVQVIYEIEEEDKGTPCKHSHHGMCPLPDSAWISYFSFVPHRLIDCEDLFTDKNKSDPYPAHYKWWIAEHAAFTDHIEFEEGYSFDSVEENMVLLHLVKLPFVKTVCETGFNAGHSALLWLTARNDSTLFSFDNGAHKYSRPIAQWIKDKFPGRFHVTWGRSEVTLKHFRRQMPEVKCDLMIIDGGHFYTPAKADLDNFFHMAAVNNIIYFDNYPMNNKRCMEELGKVWEDGKKTAMVVELFNCQYRKSTSSGRTGFSVGRFNTLGYTTNS